MENILQALKSVFRGVYNAIEASKTHWDTRREETVEYTFDGNIEGKVYISFDENYGIVKVADDYPIDAAILKYQCDWHEEWIDEDTGEKMSEDYPDDLWEMEEGDVFWEEVTDIPGLYYGWCGLTYADRDIEPNEDMGIPRITKGLYFGYESYEDGWCTYNTRLKFVLATGELKKLDEKYLPDNLATAEDVEAAKATADNAQTTADNAQATAESAQATANNAQTTAEQQADWNESNADSVSYVKNRTHSMKYVAGDALTKRIVLYPESRAVVIESASNENIAYSLVNFTESAGIKFHSYSNYNPLTYDGLDEDGNHVFRASLYWNNVTARFVISKDLSEVKIYAYTTSNVGNPEVDIKWAAVEEEITPLPEKYIPDSIARKADITIPPMTPATADEDGASGLVPAPAAGQQDMVLHGDGTWRAVEGGGGKGHEWKLLLDLTLTQATYSLVLTSNKDGNAISCGEIWASLYVPENFEGSNYYVGAFYPEATAGQVAIAYSANQRHYTTIYVTPIGGIAAVSTSTNQYSVPVTGKTSFALTPGGAVNNGNAVFTHPDVLTGIRFTGDWQGTKSFPIGTKVIIYGR